MLPAVRCDRDGDDILAQPFARDLEGQQRAGGVLEKGVDLGQAAQPPVMLRRAPVHGDPGLGFIQQISDFPRLKAVDAKQMSMGKRSEEHTSELQSLMRISYAVFCLKKKIK